MNIEQFRVEVIDNINSRQLGLIVRECNAIKNNGVKLCGVCIGAVGGVIFPSIYLEKYYERHNLGEELDSIIDEILIVSEEAQYDGKFDAGFYEDFSNVKDCLRTKIINTEKNEELLLDTPSRKFLDLSIVAYCSLDKVFGMEASILVKSSHIEKWGITSDELLDLAYSNTKNKYDVLIKDMEEIVCNIKGCISDNEKYENTPCLEEIKNVEKGVMYVMSLNGLGYGAISMTFDDVLDELLKEREGGVYILPSSIHEVILIFDCYKDLYNGESFSDLVRMVNEDCLSDEEILSNHAYYYSPERGYLFV